MNYLIACGGTSGHINPAIAIADELRRRDPDAKFIFIGMKRNLESELVPRAGYEIRFIETSGLSRDKSFAGVRHNVRMVKKFLDSKRAVKHIINEFHPDAAIGTGGYVSAPVIRAACERHIPTVIHEQNAFAGVTTKMLAGKVDRILLSFKLAKPIKGVEKKTRLVGNPVRRAFLELDRKTARAELGIPENERVVLSCGGSLGATKLNEAFVGFAKKVAADGIDFAMIRLGFRGYGESGVLKLDDRFEENLTGAKAAGLKVGVYFFSQAITVEEGLEEAKLVLDTLQGRELDFPVVFDQEEIYEADARTDNLDPSTASDIAVAFCDAVKDGGYNPMIYANTRWFVSQMDFSRLDGYSKWLAQYYRTPFFPYQFQIWQYTSSGSVDGIQGNVDLNLCFTTDF